MSWFRKHLNWTLFFSLLSAPIMHVIIIIVWLMLEDYSIIGKHIGYDNLAIYPTIPFHLFFLLIVPAWFLVQKGRSLWNLLYLLLGLAIGYIVILCIENKRRQEASGTNGLEKE